MKRKLAFFVFIFLGVTSYGPLLSFPEGNIGVLTSYFWQREKNLKDDHLSELYIDVQDHQTIGTFFQARERILGRLLERQSKLTPIELSGGFEYSKVRFNVGRMVQGYGNGEFFNPINPFNKPLLFSLVDDRPQSVDGAELTYFPSDSLKVLFLYLNAGDLWSTLDIDLFESLHLSFVGGEIGEKKQGGGQLSGTFAESLLFAQFLFEEKEKKNYFLFGFDRQLLSSLHLRAEYLREKQKNPLAIFSFIYEGFEHLKVLQATLMDEKTFFTSTLLKAIWTPRENLEAQLYTLTPYPFIKNRQTVQQKIYPYQAGVLIKYYF